MRVSNGDIHGRGHSEGHVMVMEMLRGMVRDRGHGKG